MSEWQSHGGGTDAVEGRVTVEGHSAALCTMVCRHLPPCSSLICPGSSVASRTLSLECLTDTPHCAPNWIRFSPVHTHSTLLLFGYSLFWGAVLESKSGSHQGSVCPPTPLLSLTGRAVTRSYSFCFFPSSQICSPCTLVQVGVFCLFFGLVFLISSFHHLLPCC